MNEKIPLSVVVITKNEERNIKDCIESVKDASEVIVLDDNSSDKTVEIAESFGAKVSTRQMDIEGTHRNYAYSLATNEWVLSLDADERATPELMDEIAALLKQPDLLNGYHMPRKNFIGSRWVRYGGWYPSPQLKLFKKSEFKYEEVEVHPRAFMKGETGSLKGDIIHYSYKDIADFINKFNNQTTREAQKWFRSNTKMGLGRAMRRTIDRFFRSFLGKKGFRDGFIGFVVAIFAGLYQIVSYAKCWEMKQK